MAPRGIAAFLLISSAAYADDYHLWIRAEAWFADVGGDARINRAGVAGTKFDISDLLGDPSAEFGAGGGLTMVFFDSWRVHLDGWREDFDGTSTLTAATTIRGTAFAATTAVASELEMAEYSLVGEYNFPLHYNGTIGVFIGTEIGVKYLDARGSIKSTTIPGLRESGQIGLPIPLLGSHVEIAFYDEFILDLTARSFMWGDLAGVDVAVWDLAAQLDWRFWRGMYASAGYRYRSWAFDKGGTDSFDVEMDVSGPFFEIGYRF